MIKRILRALFGNDVSDWTYSGMAYFTVIFLAVICWIALKQSQ